MKQLIFHDICQKLDDLRIPYTQDDEYIRVNTAFYDVGYNTEPRKVLYELSVFVDEANRSVSMVVRTSDEYLLASGADARARGHPPSSARSAISATAGAARAP
jgi:hypothetical protein